MKVGLAPCLAILVCLGGCAGRTAGEAVLSPVSTPTAPDASFAALVAAQPEGTVLPMSYTPLGGQVLVTVGGVYESGRGKTCRQAVAVSPLGERTVFAACRAADGTWTYVPPIFERTPR